MRARQEDNQEHIRSLTIGLLLLLCSIIIIITLLQAADLFSILLFLETPGAPWTPREELRRKTCKVLIGQLIDVFLDHKVLNGRLPMVMHFTNADFHWTHYSLIIILLMTIYCFAIFHGDHNHQSSIIIIIDHVDKSN